MRVVSQLLWVVTGLAAIVSGLNYLLGNPASAPQQAAGAAMACATVVIPYVLARAWDHAFLAGAAEKKAVAGIVPAKTSVEEDFGSPTPKKA